MILRSLPARQAPVAVLDLEMTGLSPTGDRVCEVAVVRGRGGRIEREYQTLVQPGIPMGAAARACHGITDRMLIGAPVFGEIAGDVVVALRDAVVVCHNVDVDLGFLDRELDGAPVVLPPPITLDTLLIARRLFAFRRNSLAALCDRLGIEIRGGHRALADARATFALYATLMAALDPAGRMAIGDVADLVGAMAPNSPRRLRHQQLLVDAFAQRRSVVLDYQSTSDPLAGVVRRRVDVWFLRLPRIQGYCHLRRSVRVFRVDRIRSVTWTDHPYTIPDDAVSRL